MAVATELRIGDWRVDARGNEIEREGEVVRLEPKAIEVLVFLAEHAGEVIGREELLARVWPKVVVGDDALTQAIIKLRKALGDEAQSPKYIETIPKRGYRLIAQVISAGAQPSAVEPTLARPAAAGRRRWAAIAGGGIAVAALIVGIAFHRLEMPWPIAQDPRSLPVAPTPPMIAILPLANLSGDPRRDYFSDGLTEDIINGLGRFSALRVMSRGAVEPFRARPAAPQAVRDRLGVRYVLTGSVRESEGRLRVAVELSDADRGTVIWSDRYDGDGRDVFEIQDRIVRDTVGALALKVTAVERERGATRPVESLEAYDLVLRARELIHHLNREDNRQARVMLARAVELAPSYAEAYVALAHAEYRRADQGWMEDPAEGMRRVEAHARHALSLPDRGAHARAYAQLARVHARDLDTALQDATRAVALNPSDPVSLYALGSVMIWLGRLEEGVAALEAARRFDPGLDDIMLPLGYYQLGRFREALADVDGRLARNPDVVFLLAVRAATLARLDLGNDARDAVARLRRLAPFSKVEEFGTAFRNPAHTAALQDGLRKAGL